MSIELKTLPLSFCGEEVQNIVNSEAKQYIIDILGKYDGTSFNKKRELSIIEAIYFSFVTQSTIGYGDFSPNTHIAKIVVIIHILVTYILFGLTVLV